MLWRAVRKRCDEAGACTNPTTMCATLCMMQAQEIASIVLAELTHIVARDNDVAARRRITWGMQRLQRLPPELAAEGVLAALRLITEARTPRD